MTENSYDGFLDVGGNSTRLVGRGIDLVVDRIIGGLVGGCLVGGALVGGALVGGVLVKGGLVGGCLTEICLVGGAFLVVCLVGDAFVGGLHV